MPIYSFASEDGTTIEEVVSSGTKSICRDGVTYNRSIASEGFFVPGQVRIPTQAEQVKDGYYKLEQSKGSRFLKNSTFTTKQIKKAWGF